MSRLREAGIKRKSQFEAANTASQDLIDAALQKEALLRAAKKAAWKARSNGNGHGQTVPGESKAIAVFSQTAEAKSFTSLLEELSVGTRSDFPAAIEEVLLNPGEEQAINAVIAKSKRRLPTDWRRSKNNDIHRRVEVVSIVEALEDIRGQFPVSGSHMDASSDVISVFHVEGIASGIL